VNPPVVFKEVFGEFDAYPRSDDPVYLNMDPAWYDAHIQTRHVPVFSEPVTCNRALFPMLIGALRDVQACRSRERDPHVLGLLRAEDRRAVADRAAVEPRVRRRDRHQRARDPFGGTPTMDPEDREDLREVGLSSGAGRF
jgi:hypothetical protein